MLAAATLIFGSGPALAGGANPVGSTDGQASSSGYLTPEASWGEDSKSLDPGDEAVTLLAAAEAAGTPAALARRRPGIFSLSTPSRTAATGVASGARFTSAMPLASRKVTSGFGLRRHPLLGGWRVHAGVDLAAPTGSPVVATAAGTVSIADWSGGYGLLVAVEHGGGRQTRYAHLSRLNVAAGQRVRQGDVIGFVGSTGRSTGPHLHYETRVNGQAINPRR